MRSLPQSRNSRIDSIAIGYHANGLIDKVRGKANLSEAFLLVKGTIRGKASLLEAFLLVKGAIRARANGPKRKGQQSK
ncbi:hypothetical protein ACERII_13995 [Evansella sp. AB-rgal1]|uniref:hypothetical protein n=1 Tax=Evansella sp. AB-rgal1 TaxID=3242696 RepID=UPI00359E09A1